MNRAPEQLDLLTPTVQPARQGTIAEQFCDFHMYNPHVYKNLAILALRAVRSGQRRIGIAQLFEVLRWEVSVATSGGEFKLNNNLRSHYARLLMQCEPELAGVFETRELRSA